MRTLRYLFFASLATMLMAADCSNEDNEFYNDVFVNVPYLVEIETRPEYFVGDELIINTTAMRRYVDESGYNTRLDLWKSSGFARSFSFTYLLEKRNGDTWQTVNVQNLLVDYLGDATGTDFIFAKSEFNISEQTYEFKSGIRLPETGNYRLSFGYNSASVNSVELRSDSTGNDLIVNINSFNSDIDSEGYYYFNVN